MVRNRDIAEALEQFAPLHTQEEWDNSGFQVGNPGDECTGVLLCVDVTEDIVEEASGRGCNMIVAHHPLIFRGLSHILGGNRVERVVAKALQSGVTVYSCHTPVDCAKGGVSWYMASVLGLSDIKTLAPEKSGSDVGLGAIGDLPVPMTAVELVSAVKSAFGSPVARCSALPAGDMLIGRVAMCGGSGAEFVADAIRQGAQAYITSDTKHNYFLDHVGDIFIIDIGHYESESCTKQIFYHVLSEKFPNFALHYSDIEKNPINYL